MPTRILTSAVFVIVSVASVLAQSDARKDYEEKARKAAEAQLSADWAKLDQFVARLNLYLVQDEEFWLKHLPAFEALADRRGAARDDKEKLSALDLELQQLLERLSEERPAGFAVDKGNPDPLEGGYGFFEQKWPELLQGLRDATESRQDAHGAEDAIVKAQKARLAAAELTMRKFDAANDAIDARAQCESYLLQIRQTRREHTQSRDALAAAEKIRDAAEKARDDHAAKPPAASSPEAEQTAYRKKATELNNAFEAACHAADGAENKVKELDADLDAYAQRREQFVVGTTYRRQSTQEALRGQPQWQDLLHVSDENAAGATHVSGTVHQQQQVQRLALAKAVTHLRLSTSHPIISPDENTKLVRQLFQTMAQLPKLRSVELHFLQGSVDPEAVKLLADAPGLEELALTAADWGDASAWAIVGPLKLRRLHLAGGLSDKPIAKHLAALAGAKELSLGFARWPAEKTLPEALASMSNLVTLNLSGLSDEGVVVAMRSKSLREVACGTLNRAIAEALKSNRTVTTLDLSNSAIIGADLDLLAGVSHLRRLLLTGCAELDEFAAGNLRKLSGLEEIDLFVSGVPDWSVRVLRKHMPSCRITN